jgi:hypothetical protein
VRYQFRDSILLAASVKVRSSNGREFDRTFRDDEGNIVIAQKPNLPILVWASSSLLQLVGLEGKLQYGLELIAFGTLYAWAWMELFQGVNYFRRSLGLVVLVGLIVVKLRA